jgi:hypothetical protein
VVTVVWQRQGRAQVEEAAAGGGGRDITDGCGAWHGTANSAW